MILEGTVRSHNNILYLYICKTYKSKPITDSDQAEGCRNNLSFWRGWKGNIKYLITLWKAKTKYHFIFRSLLVWLTKTLQQSEQILTYCISDSILYYLNLIVWRS